MSGVNTDIDALGVFSASTDDASETAKDDGSGDVLGASSKNFFHWDAKKKGTVENNKASYTTPSLYI